MADADTRGGADGPAGIAGGPDTADSADSAADAAAGPARPAPLWRNRDYVGFLIGTGVSSLGTSMSGLAYPLLILYATGSVTRAGIVAACRTLGLLLTILLGGALADRLSRRMLIVSTSLVQAVAVASVAVAVILGHVNIVHIGAVAFVQGMCGGLGSGALSALTKRVVPPDQLATASAATQGRDFGAQAIGSPLGGFLFGLARWLPFLGDAASFLAVTLGIAAIRTPLGPDPTERKARPPMWRSVREGLAYVLRNAFLRFVCIFSGVANAAFMGAMLLLIALVRLRGGSPTVVGSVEMLIVIGGFAGSLTSSLALRLMRGSTLTVILCWLVAGAFAVSALVPEPWEIGVVLGCMMVLVVPLNVVIDTYQIRIVPDELMGRVSTAGMFFGQSLCWVSPVAAGLVADHLGVVTAMMSVAGIFGVLALWCTGSRALRQVDAPVESERPDDAVGVVASI
jgi:MFS family permease